MEGFKIKPKKHSLERGRGGVVFKMIFIIMFVILLLYALSLILTFGWAIINSLKPKELFTDHAWAGKTYLFPSMTYNGHDYNYEHLSGVKYYLQNYLNAYKLISYKDGDKTFTFVNMLFNSIWFAVGSAGIPIFLTSMTAYVFSKYNFVFKKFLYTLVILIMMVPVLGNFPASYKLMFDLKLVNSPLILLTATSGFGATFLILKASYDGVSWSYAESAQIDGASKYAIYFKIMMPQIFPALFTLFILSFIGAWNNYLGPYLYLTSMPTLATGLYVFEKSLTYGGSDMPALFAGIILMSLPIIIIFIAFSDKIMSKVSIGGLKG